MSDIIYAILKKLCDWKLFHDFEEDEFGEERCSFCKKYKDDNYYDF